MAAIVFTDQHSEIGLPVVSMRPCVPWPDKPDMEVSLSMFFLFKCTIS